jgi:imidazolonepropionase-like amidohydrolase/sugar lactone lactonase YvrE
MKAKRWWYLVLVAGFAASTHSQAQQPARAAAVLYEGARLITGENRPPIESSAFLVENGVFTRVGRKGEIPLPAGAQRVDLTGKTVMPGLIELHAHLGYFKDNAERRALTTSFTKAQLQKDLQQLAYYGVSAVLSLGSDPRELVYDIRDEWRRTPPPNMSRLYTAGPGISAPNAGPAGELSNAVYFVTTEAQARKSVQELAAHKVDGWIKIWHDSRRGKMAPEVIRAIIDEAHKNKLRVAAHIHELEDFKDLIRWGVDGLAHPTWRQESVEPVDDELIALLKQHPNLFMCTSFWTPRNQIYGARPYWIDEPIVRETFSPEEIRRLEVANTPADAAEKWASGRVPRSLKKLRDAGLRFGLGTDMGGGGPPYFGLSSHVEMESLVKGGLTPAEAIVAATGNAAQILGAADLGTVAARKSADFLVLDANPLDNIANSRRIARVYMRGQEVDRAALRAAWGRTGATAAAPARPSYRAVGDWAQLPGGMPWGSVSGVTADATGNVYVFRRAEPPILQFDAKGAFVRSLAEKVISGAHGIRVDPSGMLWVADVRGHVVHKMDPSGKILLTLGKKGVSGTGPDTFNGPTDVQVTPSGDIFVTDGQFNSRIVHFAADGTFKDTWGTNGSGPGQFKVPHGIGMDSTGRLFVADRDNNRIAIFDQRGTFLAEWTQFGQPSGLFIDKNDTLYVAAIGEKAGLVVGSAKTGQVDQILPIPAKELNGAHLVTADTAGNVYVADLLAQDVKKFVRN